MKIAVLIYGRLNRARDHYNNIVGQIGREHDVDFFMSSDESSENVLNEFLEIYKPKKYNNKKKEYTNNLETYVKQPEVKNHNMICHFINKQEVFKHLQEYIEETGNIYDTIISLRLDVVIHNKFIFEGMKENTIYIPSGYDYGHPGINDQIAYGKYEVMEKYNNIYRNVIKLLDDKLTIVHPETITLANLVYNKVEIERVKLDYCLER